MSELDFHQLQVLNKFAYKVAVARVQGRIFTENGISLLKGQGDFVFAYDEKYDNYLRLPIPLCGWGYFATVMGTDIYYFNFKKMLVAKFSLNLATFSFVSTEGAQSIRGLSLESQEDYDLASDVTTKRIYRTGGSFESEGDDDTERQESTGETIAIDLSQERPVMI